MRIPFTLEDFLSAFSHYNAAVGPMPFVLYGVAILLIVLALRGPLSSGRAILVILGVLWIWMGVVYHWIFFRPINPIASIFAVIFVVQGIRFAYTGRSDPRFRPPPGLNTTVGWILIGYALVAYPIVGFISGHGFPTGPTFGLPCPTTLFTFGLLLWVQDRVPGHLLVVPTVWSLLGASAGLSLGMTEDFALPIGALVATTLIHRRNRALSPNRKEVPRTRGFGRPNAPSPASLS